MAGEPDIWIPGGAGGFGAKGGDGQSGVNQGDVNGKNGSVTGHWFKKCKCAGDAGNGKPGADAPRVGEDWGPVIGADGEYGGTPPTFSLSVDTVELAGQATPPITLLSRGGPGGTGGTGGRGGPGAPGGDAGQIDRPCLDPGASLEPVCQAHKGGTGGAGADGARGGNGGTGGTGGDVIIRFRDKSVPDRLQGWSQSGVGGGAGAGGAGGAGAPGGADERVPASASSDQWAPLTWAATGATGTPGATGSIGGTGPNGTIKYIPLDS